jgi:hypothetical protein
MQARSTRASAQTSALQRLLSGLVLEQQECRSSANADSRQRGAGEAESRLLDCLAAAAGLQDSELARDEPHGEADKQAQHIATQQSGSQA